MKNIGILTSGGDAPGMNAAIHSIVMTASFHNIHCYGFERGYNGLIDANYRSLSIHNTQHISSLGGTILKSARCPRMHQSQYLQQAAGTIKDLKLDGLIVIGGDGSFKGAVALNQYSEIPIIGVPGTIDNDIDGSDYSIGYYTAVQTAVDAIDKVRDTADAFERIFIVEVMGRHSGHIALDVGISTEAEQIITPEMNIPDTELVENITCHINQYLQHFGHSSYIIVVAENSFDQGSLALAETLTQDPNIDCRAVVLGHIQRGGIANPEDRLLAIKLGAFAVEGLLKGEKNKMAGEIKGELGFFELSQTGMGVKQPDPYLLSLYKNKLLM